MQRTGYARHVDPKAAIAKKAAEDKLSTLLTSRQQDIYAIVGMHRGPATVLLTTGELLEVIILLSTREVLCVRPLMSTQAQRLYTCDIAAIDIG